MSNFLKVREQFNKGMKLPKYSPAPLLSSAMVDILNQQIKNEISSAYLYLSMSAWCHDYSLNGMGSWLEEQVEEELSHAEKFFEYLISRNGKVTLLAIDAPPSEFESPVELWQMVYEQEVVVSGLLNKIVDLAEKDKDRTTFQFMQWFITEQIEELESAYDVVQRLMIAGDETSALLQIDEELSDREDAADANGS